MADPMGKREDPISTAKVENPYVFNDFGSVSQEAADLHGRYMKKYKNVDPDHYVKPPSSKEIKALKILNDLKKKKPIRKRRKAVSQEFVDDDEDEDGNDVLPKHEHAGDNGKSEVIRIKVGKPAKENVAENCSSKNSELGAVKQENSFCKRPQIRPPMTYEELLKLAERNQRELLMAKINRTQPERPMTKKEKLSYFTKIKEANKRKQLAVRT